MDMSNQVALGKAQAEPRRAYLFSGVPNTKAGRRFLADVRRYINRPETDRLRVMCNGPRVETAKADGFWSGAYRSYLPQRHAETFRIYWDTLTDIEQRRARYALMDEVQSLRDLHRGTEQQNVALIATCSLLQHENARMAAQGAGLMLRAAGAEYRAMESERRAEQARANATARLAVVPGWLLRLCEIVANLRTEWNGGRA
jgi:hypothetical protein